MDGINNPRGFNPARPSQKPNYDISHALTGHQTEASFPIRLNQSSAQETSTPSWLVDKNDLDRSASGIKGTSVLPESPVKVHSPHAPITPQNTTPLAAFISHDLHDTRADIPTIPQMVEPLAMINAQSTSDNLPVYRDVEGIGNPNATQVDIPVARQSLPLPPRPLPLPPRPGAYVPIQPITPSAPVKEVVSEGGDKLQVSSEFMAQFDPKKSRQELMKEKVGVLVGDLVSNLRNGQPADKTPEQHEFEQVHGFISKLRKYQNKQYLGGCKIQGIMPEVKHEVGEALFHLNPTAKEANILNGLTMATEEEEAAAALISNDPKIEAGILGDISERGKKIWEYFCNYKKHPELLETKFRMHLPKV